MKIEQTLWVEKYRPRTLKEVALSEDHYQEFGRFLKNKEIPNILLSGPAGGGKTTLARIVTSKAGVISQRDHNVLEINGSAKETRGIDFVDKVIEPFLKIPPAGQDKYRIVFIDEGDNLTEASFRSLRGVIEKYQVKYGRFILTCNYLSKIPDPVQSRFAVYMFKQLPMEFVDKYCKDILSNEKVKYQEEDLKFIIDNLYPDVRRIVYELQRRSINGTLKVNKDVALTSEKAIIGSIIEIVGYLKDKKPHKVNKLMTSIINLLDKQDLEFRNIYVNLFNSKQIPVPAKVIVNKYSREHQSCLVPSMHFAAMVMEIIQSVNQYYRSIEK